MLDVCPPVTCCSIEMGTWVLVAAAVAAYMAWFSSNKIVMVGYYFAHVNTFVMFTLLGD
jgi:hypothetical protein